ncbi:DUF4249 domain-containing protein [Algoriphagus antarcticus]|uniref:Uncharacterized protein DUF4249 n=1 Tax=Algoriphagus antarcticus TaxID=238540 RepID=A0A3E0D8K1_9BACT|nr:DUF4249 domain-containing protein [Algoriphagus antarcticus]REG78271.1 uncharacterized protein DUF4249 [Algoriphagus antarcticus]
MKTRYLTISILSFLALMSCEQFLEVDLPGQEPKLVLNSLIEPSDTVKVFLTQSRGVLAGREYDEFDLVKDATVQLKDGTGNIYTLDYIDRSRPYDTDAFYYLRGKDLVGGESFEISVEKEGFPKISSEEVLPQKVDIKSIEMTNLGSNGGLETEDVFEVTVKFSDPPGNDFYEISGGISGRDIFVNAGDTTYFSYSSALYPKPVNPIYEKDYLLRNVLLFRDNLLNGAESEMVFRTSIRRDLDLKVTIRLSHVSESYYLYYDTADLQQYNSGDILSQPVLVYTNIKNGLGIFKARNTDERVIEMRVDD